MAAIGAAFALVATALVPGTTAIAAPGDLAHGVVFVDANNNGVLDAGGSAGEADTALAGVAVRLLDGAGVVVATTTTDASGAWSFTEAQSAAATGPFAVEIDAAGVSGNGYATPVATSADNDFARAGGPQKATAALPDGDTDVELNALLFPVWKLDAKLADDPDGVGGKSILTGAPTWDAGDTEPGHDDSTSNTKVRSADVVAFNWSLTAESEDGSLGDTFADAIFEQTITLNGGAVANFASIPAICDQVKSRIVAQPSGTAIAAKATPPAGTTSLTLTCVLGEMGVDPAPSAYILSTQVQPSSLSPNGSSFDTTSRFYAVDAGGTATAQPAAGPEVPPIEITAAPRYDVEKIPGTQGNMTMMLNGVPTPGIYHNYTVQISTDRKVGVEAFAQPLTLEESFWGQRSVVGPNGEPTGEHISDLKWYMETCTQSSGTSQAEATSVYGRIGINALATEANSVRNSGTCAYERTGADDTGNYTLTLSLDIS